MDDSRYLPHVSATATCVELALRSVEDDLLQELARGAGAASSLRRVLDRVRARRESIAELIDPSDRHRRIS